MEKFTAQIKKRLFYGRIYLCTCIVIFGLSLLIRSLLKIPDNQDFLLGYAVGLFFGFGFVVIFGMIKYQKALKNDEKLKELYILEKDERAQAIDQKTGRTADVVIMAVTAISAPVAGLFNKTVFITLVAVSLFAALANIIAKLYYSKKM